MAFASSIHLLPHTYRLALRLTFPYGRCTGFPCSVSVTHGWVRRALSTGSVDAHDKEGRSPCTRYSALLAQAWQHLWLVFCDDVYQAFTWGRPAIHPSTTVVIVKLHVVCSANIARSLGANGARQTRRAHAPRVAWWTAQDTRRGAESPGHLTAHQCA